MTKDTLDRTVAFLQKRDGTDKTLKILRYSAKLVLALNLLSANQEATKRLKNFESSVGTSRKALRIGKFLQDINELRRTKSFVTSEGFLELVASGGECIYYFVEQFIWLVKAGAIDKTHGPRLTKLSATFELLGYVGSVTLKSIQVTAMLQKEAALGRVLEAHKAKANQVCELLPHTNGMAEANGETEGSAADTLTKDEKSLRSLKFKRVLKLLSLVQDLSDSMLALADVIDEPKQPPLLRSSAFLAGAGLLSALISAHKNWITAS